MTLYEAVECAASDLPPNWTIEISIEQDAACVYLYDPSYALGSDTGGSIRIPAGLHGLVGFKNSQHLKPNDGSIALAPSLDTTCAITRSVADAVRLHEVLAARTVAPDPRPLAARRLAVVRTLMLDALETPVAQAFEAALDTLRRAGARIETIDLPLLDEITALTRDGGLAAAESWAGHRERLARCGERYDPRVAARIRRGAAIAAESLATLHCRRRDLVKLKNMEWLISL